jgi:hypothetical protein
MGNDSVLSFAGRLAVPKTLSPTRFEALHQIHVRVPRPGAGLPVLGGRLHAVLLEEALVEEEHDGGPAVGQANLLAAPLVLAQVDVDEVAEVVLVPLEERVQLTDHAGGLHGVEVPGDRDADGVRC